MIVGRYIRLDREGGVDQKSGSGLAKRLRNTLQVLGMRRDVLEASQSHIRQVEDRAAIEIDRAREEAKARQRELAALQREHLASLKRLEALTQSLHGAEKRVVAAEARAQALAMRVLVKAPPHSRSAARAGPAKKPAQRKPAKRAIAT